MICLEIFHYALKFPDNFHINRAVAGFNLNCKTRVIESENTFPSNDVHPTISAWRGDLYSIALCLKYCTNKPCEFVPPEFPANVFPNFIGSHLFNIYGGFFSFALF